MYRARVRAELTAWIHALKEARGCEDGSSGCGKTHDPEFLDFDHVCGVEGHRYGVSGGVSSCWSKQRLLQEIAKCDVRCANCHRKKTAADVRADRAAGRLHERDDD